MSFWGVGPVFVLVAVFVSATAAIFSKMYSEMFTFSCCSVVFYILGAVFSIFGFYLWFSSGVDIKRCIDNRILAKHGVFGIIRNPIYSGILHVLFGIFLILQSWLLLVSLVIVYFILKILLKKEEIVLTKTFGKEYLDYKKKVNILLPKPKDLYLAYFYPIETEKIDENFYSIKKFDTNIYLYKTENGYICFDTAYDHSKLTRELEKLNIKPTEITDVFLTHSDHDHVRGLGLFSNAKLYIGKKEEPLFIGKKRRLFLIYKSPKIIRKINLLDDNHEIVIDGVKIRTIYSTGHTIGHVCYLIDDTYLITGDSIALQNGLIKPFYRIFNMNHSQTKKSAQKIAKFRGKYFLCTSHTGIVKP